MDAYSDVFQTKFEEEHVLKHHIGKFIPDRFDLIKYIFLESGHTVVPRSRNEFGRGMMVSWRSPAQFKTISQI